MNPLPWQAVLVFVIGAAAVIVWLAVFMATHVPAVGP